MESKNLLNRPTIEVLYEKIDNLSMRVEKVEEKLDKKFATNEKFNGLERRVNEIEDSMTWVTRLLFASLIGAVMSIFTSVFLVLLKFN